ncbi:MAG TPA: glycosyltransferase family 9 protein, partial [Candidatus Wallbacteria bacterium]|nr:glycosyltransferase family 9 protein [Candidatus Wallbacteria bacterium]
VHSARNQINLLKTLPEEFRPPAKLLDDFKLETFIAADHSRKAFENFITDNGIAAETPADKIIIYHITPSNNFKKWHAENYAALINMCERHPALSKYSITHIVIGRAEDDKEFEKINSAVKTVRGKIISACGRLSLGAVYNLAKASSCFVGPDSGPLHIASAAGILTIGLFGPTNVETFAPPSGNFHGVYNPDLTCRPCDQKRCANNFKCIKSIKASDVFYAMLKNILK